ncbi:hypothetical protein RRF57_011819 [Xylaria bambusicola]|uniref:Uncharacterized protein n=1 Tax=Xylaria bambusicola TaxID=326684 RepID=A0AAN7ZAD5_9PEZI
MKQQLSRSYHATGTRWARSFGAVIRHNCGDSVALLAEESVDRINVIARFKYQFCEEAVLEILAYVQVVNHDINSQSPKQIRLTNQRPLGSRGELIAPAEMITSWRASTTQDLRSQKGVGPLLQRHQPLMKAFQV